MDWSAFVGKGYSLFNQVGNMQLRHVQHDLHKVHFHHDKSPY